MTPSRWSSYRPSLQRWTRGASRASARKLRRFQSVVSQTRANLELQLRLKLFDCSSRYPQLIEEGHSLLVDARSVARNVDEFKATPRATREGLEPELSVAMNMLYPMEALTRAAARSRRLTPIRETSILAQKRVKLSCLDSERSLKREGANSCLTFFSATH